MGGAGVFRGGLRFQCTEVRWGEHLNAKESGGDTLLVQRNQGGKHFSAKESVGGGGISLLRNQVDKMDSTEIYTFCCQIQKMLASANTFLLTYNYYNIKTKIYIFNLNPHIIKV